LVSRLIDCGANLYLRNRSNQTPLLLATGQVDDRLAVMLIESGAPMDDDETL
jgi:ankyrin repeat protein